ncbi:MAG TPA: serine hydrolase domain-containing protein [Acidobacteriota bacterium]|nr:serine hydrolase domain-containing protein [Acidobacteriota bacterium]
MHQKPGTRLWIMALTVLILAASALADETTDKVDKLFAAWDTTVTPGAALAVVRDGKIVYERGYGMASFEDGLVMTPQKVFDIGSTSKQFTAACIAMLVRDGKVGLSDDIRKYLPEMPNYGKVITVDHLLHHTSGLRDYNALLELSGFRADGDCPTVEEAYEVICRQKRLNYLPGAEYSYTNTGFFLLSRIVEKVSGRTLNAFAQERIFRPLGMAHTLFQDDHNQIVRNRARGYERSGGGFRVNMSNWDETGDGNVYTTVEDLALWDQAFYSNALGKDLMDTLHTRGVLNDGKKIEYAFGLMIGEHKGLKTVSHGGAWAGYRAGFVRFPDEKFSVICLANLADMNPSGLCMKVADIYLAGKIKEAPKADKGKIETVRVPKAELEAFAGNYQDAKFGQWFPVTFDGDVLRIGFGSQSFALTPVGRTIFQAPDAPADVEVEFLPAAPGKPAGALVRILGDEGYILTKEAPFKPMTDRELGAYAGEFVSEELLGARYGIVVEKDGLVVKFRNPIVGALKAMAPDKFMTSGLNFEFARRGGRVTGFDLSVGRAARIEFRKIGTGR